MGAANEYFNFHGLLTWEFPHPLAACWKYMPHDPWDSDTDDFLTSFQDISLSLDQKIIKPTFFRFWKLVCFNIHYGSCFLCDFFIQISYQVLQIQSNLILILFLVTVPPASCDGHIFSGVIERANLALWPFTDHGFVPTHMLLFLFLPLSFGSTNEKLKCYALRS